MIFRPVNICPWFFRCGMITKREADRLCRSFLSDNRPPSLPEHFAFDVYHRCAWGSRGSFIPARYNSSRAKCIRCSYCNLFFSPNKFIFHSHRLPSSKYVQPDAANFNSWRRHIKLSDTSNSTVNYVWEDVKAMFNGTVFLIDIGLIFSFFQNKLLDFILLDLLFQKSHFGPHLKTF